MPSPTAPSALVLCDGGLASLVAMFMLDERDSAIAWTLPAGTPSLDSPGVSLTAAHAAIAQRQADLAGLRRAMAPAATISLGNGSDGTAHPLPWAMVLLMACKDAARLGCERVIWPILAGDEPDALHAADQTAHLVARLSWLPSLENRPGHASRAAGSAAGGRDESCTPVIHIPLADLQGAQLADLALDLDVPSASCWWNQPEEDASPIDAKAATRARGLWTPLLETAGRLRGYATHE